MLTKNFQAAESQINNIRIGAFADFAKEFRFTHIILLQVAVYCMRGKRTQMITRHKVPNLAQMAATQQTHKSSEQATFFSKISNSLRLLQQPPTSQKQIQEKQHKFNGVRRNNISLRMKELSKHRARATSFEINSANAIPPLQTANGTRKPQTGKKQEPYIARSEKNIHRQNEITGTTLAAMPFHRILGLRKLHEDQPAKHIYKKPEKKLITESDEEIFQAKEPEEDLSPVKDNPIAWSRKIIGKDSEIYQLHEKKLMEKFKGYRSKQLRLDHKSEWR